VIGKVYTMPPQPPVAENTQWFDGGVLTIGVEYRNVDPGNLQATYVRTEFEAELFERWPEGGFVDEGVSIHVCDAADGHEFLRFDVFDADPHYHYVHRLPPGCEPVNNVIDFDVAAHGEMLPWVIDRLRTRLPQMLAAAGASTLVDRVDAAGLSAVIDDVAGVAEQAQQRLRRS
jgi:hypothetical protein